MSNVAYPVGSVHRSRDLWEELPGEDHGPMFKSWHRAAKALFIPLMLNAIGLLLLELRR